MKMEESIGFGSEIIKGLAGNRNVKWFVDANVLIKGLVTELFDDASNVFITDTICAEVRKRPEAKRGNRFVDILQQIGHVVEENWYDKEITQSVEFLIECAKQLTPAIRVNTQWFVDKEGLTLEQAESRAIEKLAVDGCFFECDLKNRALEAGWISEDDAKIDKRTRKAWFEYPKKRRMKLRDGEYWFTDEILVSTAIAHSILRKEKVCILSNDKDLAAIMKQTADNWIWSASAIDCELIFGGVNWDDVSALSEQRCSDLDKYRQLHHVNTAKRGIKNRELNPSDLYEPIPNEVILCRPDDGQIGRFAFNDQMVDFAINFGWLATRYRLIRSGFWLPRF